MLYIVSKSDYGIPITCTLKPEEIYAMSEFSEWLAVQRIAETTCESDWVLSEGFIEAVGPTISMLLECGRLITSKQDLHDAGLECSQLDFLIEICDQAKVTIILRCQGFILFSKDTQELVSIKERYDGRVVLEELDVENIIWALIESWNHNPDRQRAHKVRQMLCDAAEKDYQAQGV